MPMQAIKNILFDLDGTLVDSPIDFPGIKEALGIALDQDIIGHLEWMKRHDIENYPSASEVVFQFELEASKRTKIFDGVPEFLEFLKLRSIKLGIVTRNCRQIALEQTKGIENFFLDILTRDDVQRPKPHPESFLYFKQHYGFQAHETMYIGNHQHDFEFAKNNKLKYLEFVPVQNDQGRTFEFYSYNDLKDQYFEQNPVEFT